MKRIILLLCMIMTISLSAQLPGTNPITKSITSEALSSAPSTPRANQRYLNTDGNFYRYYNGIWNLDNYVTQILLDKVDNNGINVASALQNNASNLNLIQNNINALDVLETDVAEHENIVQALEGGTVNQILSKASAIDHAYTWIDVPSGGGSSSAIGTTYDSSNSSIYSVTNVQDALDHISQNFYNNIDIFESRMRFFTNNGTISKNLSLASKASVNPVTPFATIEATNVQAALEELNNNEDHVTGGTMISGENLLLSFLKSNSLEIDLSQFALDSDITTDLSNTLLKDSPGPQYVEGGQYNQNGDLINIDNYTAWYLTADHVDRPEDSSFEKLNYFGFETDHTILASRNDSTGLSSVTLTYPDRIENIIRTTPSIAETFIMDSAYDSDDDIVRKVNLDAAVLSSGSIPDAGVGIYYTNTSTINVDRQETSKIFNLPSSTNLNPTAAEINGFQENRIWAQFSDGTSETINLPTGIDNSTVLYFSVPSGASGGTLTVNFAESTPDFTLTEGQMAMVVKSNSSADHWHILKSTSPSGLSSDQIAFFNNKGEHTYEMRTSDFVWDNKDYSMITTGSNTGKRVINAVDGTNDVTVTITNIDSSTGQNGFMESISDNAVISAIPDTGVTFQINHDDISGGVRTVGKSNLDYAEKTNGVMNFTGANIEAFSSNVNRVLNGNVAATSGTSFSGTLPNVTATSDGSSASIYGRVEITINLAANDLAVGDVIVLSTTSWSGAGTGRIETNINGAGNTSIANLNASGTITGTIPAGTTDLSLWLFSDYGVSNTGTKTYNGVSVTKQ